MTIKNLAFFGVMASILATGATHAVEPATRIATVGYVDGKINNGEINSTAAAAATGQTTAPTVKAVYDAIDAVSDQVANLDIPAAQVNSDWDAVSGVAQILNKPTLATVATSGSYTDLSNKPTIPADTGDLTNNAGFITAAGVPVKGVQQNGTDLTPDANGKVNVTVPDTSNFITSSDVPVKGVQKNGTDLTPDANGKVNVVVPTAVSDLTNDSNFITSAGVPVKGVQQNGTDLTPDANGKVNVTVPDTSNFITSSDVPVKGVQKNGTDLTPDANGKVNVVVPTAVSELTNDSGYVVSTSLAEHTENATSNQVVTGVTTENGSVKSVSSTLIANANIAAAGTANIEYGKMNSQLPHFDAPSAQNIAWASGNCTRGAPCVLTFDGSDYVWTTMEIPSGN